MLDSEKIKPVALTISNASLNKKVSHSVENFKNQNFAR